MRTHALVLATLLGLTGPAQASFPVPENGQFVFCGYKANFDRIFPAEGNLDWEDTVHTVGCKLTHRRSDSVLIMAEKALWTRVYEDRTGERRMIYAFSTTIEVDGQKMPFFLGFIGPDMKPTPPANKKTKAAAKPRSARFGQTFYIKKDGTIVLQGYHLPAVYYQTQ